MTVVEYLKQPGVLSVTGLAFDQSLTEEQYEQLGTILGEMYKTSQWAIGDYIIAGVRLFGDDAYQLAESLGIGPDSRAQYMWVAESVEPERRRPELSWSHHRSVAAMEPAEQSRWLAQAVENRWTRGELDARMRPESAWRPSLATLTAAARAVYDQADHDVVIENWNGMAVVPREAIANLGIALGVIDE